MVVKSKKFVGIWGFIIALSIVARCNSQLLFRSSRIEYILLFVSTCLAIGVNIKSFLSRPIIICDIFFAASLGLFISSEELSKYIIVISICTLFYYAIQNCCLEIKYLEIPVVAFAMITSIVTWISFFFPSFYTSNILTLFPEGSSLAYSFLHRNMYHGFTNHYSRNSYYIITGIIMLFSTIITEKKKSRIKITIIGFLFCTEFLVAKRGPTLFLIVALFIAYLKKEPSFAKKVTKSLKFLAAGVALFVLAYFFVPGVSNIVSRILSPNSSDDISSSRFYLWGVALQLFRKRPILGNGWGSYIQAMSGTTFQGAHNDYFQLLAETGIMGLMVHLLAEISCFYYSGKVFNYFNAKRYQGSLEQKWAFFSYTFQIFILLYALTGMPHYSYEQYGLYLMVCGFSIGLYKHRNRYSRGEI